MPATSWGGWIVRQGRRQVKAAVREWTTVLDRADDRRLAKRLPASRRPLQVEQPGDITFGYLLEYRIADLLFIPELEQEIPEFGKQTDA